MAEPGRLLKLVWADTALPGPGTGPGVRRARGAGRGRQAPGQHQRVRRAGVQVGGRADGAANRTDHPDAETGERAPALASSGPSPGPAAGPNRPRSTQQPPARLERTGTVTHLLDLVQPRHIPAQRPRQLPHRHRPRRGQYRLEHLPIRTTQRVGIQPPTPAAGRHSPPATPDRQHRPAHTHRLHHDRSR